MITAARELDPGIGHVNYAVADFITAELPSGAYDYISAIAVLHHLPFEDALAKARTLLRPGGTLAVLGLYRSASLTDLALSAIAFPLNRALLGWHGHERYHAPTIAPALSFREITQTVERVLPGARISRRLLWRYFAVWDKPVDA
jgi:SAM-dependent methyltransferase